jgi:hypothetical protein
MFITNNLSPFEYTGLLLRRVSVYESGHPQGVHFTKEVRCYNISWFSVNGELYTKSKLIIISISDINK